MLVQGDPGWEPTSSGSQLPSRQAVITGAVMDDPVMGKWNREQPR